MTDALRPVELAYHTAVTEVWGDTPPYAIVEEDARVVHHAGEILVTLGPEVAAAYITSVVGGRNAHEA